MTPEQRSQWNLYSCVPRCIIALAELRGKPILDDEFVNMFEGALPEWKNRFGLTSIGDAIRIIATLEIGSKPVHIHSVGEFQDFINAGGKVAHALVLTHKAWSQEHKQLVEVHHCRLLLGFESDTPNLILMSPAQDGKCYEERMSTSELSEVQAEFFVV
ncbi:MAG: hypothetical protein R3C20_12670 [Planctomycetaceae bacterium]